MMDVDGISPKKDSREEVVAALRDLMHLGPNDPAPVRRRRFQPVRKLAIRIRKTKNTRKRQRRSANNEKAGNYGRKDAFAGAAACFGVAALLVAQTGVVRGQRRHRFLRSGSDVDYAASKANTTAANTTPDAVKYHAMLDKYCVACHNKRSALPADEPVDLEAAALTICWAMRGPGRESCGS